MPGLNRVASPVGLVVLVGLAAVCTGCFQGSFAPPDEQAQGDTEGFSGSEGAPVDWPEPAIPTDVGGGSEAPEPDPAVPVVGARVEADTALMQSAKPGLNVDAPVVRVFGADGEPLAGVRVEFTLDGPHEAAELGTLEAVTGDDGRASAGSWLLGYFPGAYEVTASVPQLDNETVVFTADATTDFDIELIYLNDVDERQQEAFDKAALRWEGIILNRLQPFTGDIATFATQCGYMGASGPSPTASVVIFVELGPIDGPLNVLGAAGPCVLRRGDGSPAVGGMTFDTADLAELERRGTLDAVILHEMGHVLGIGTLWEPQGLLAEPSTDLGPGADTHFLGEGARDAFEDVLGDQFDGSTVPVENSAQQGSADGHWRESVLFNELMTPSVTGFERTIPLSHVTIASLGDFSFYTVNERVADELTLEPINFLRASGSPEPAHAEMIVPTGWIDAEGHLE